MIRALTIEERDEMFEIAEADDEEKGPKGEGFFLRRAESTTVSPTLNIHRTCSTIHGLIDNKLLEVPVTLIYKDGTSEISKVDTNALTDSGAEGEFIDQNYA
jgi:hypothetical protein